MKAEGDRWRDGARYHASRGKEGRGKERREGRVKLGEQHPFYVEAKAVGVPPFSCLCTTLKYLPAYGAAERHGVHVVDAECVASRERSRTFVDFIFMYAK